MMTEHNSLLLYLLFHYLETVVEVIHTDADVIAHHKSVGSYNFLVRDGTKTRINLEGIPKKSRNFRLACPLLPPCYPLAIGLTEKTLWIANRSPSAFNFPPYHIPAIYLDNFNFQQSFSDINSRQTKKYQYLCSLKYKYITRTKILIAAK